MSDDSKVSDLVLRWQEARREGRDVSPEELCRDAPELLGQVKHRIESLTYVVNLLGIESSDGSAIPAGNNDGELDRRSVPPVQVPGYEFLDLIDRGGMGAVYRARQRELNRVVALKMITDVHRPADRIARFRIEAESVAQLQHPNIVQIYDVGECDGHPYYAMEFVNGGSLANRLVESKVPPREAAELVETVARAIHVAHERGIVHRDLKPANVLLSADGTVKIADFGLAKRLEDDCSHTKTGEILGTPNYMAPEQAEGKTEAIGPRTDVYALGAILYELLVGEPPFKGSTAMHSLRRLISEDAAIPRKTDPKVPKDLEAICLKCLEKSPALRYATAKDLADDLRRYLDGRPIQARRIGPLRRLGKWAKRRPEWALISLILIVGAIAGLVIATSRHRDERLRREEAVRIAPQAREILKRNCYECHGSHMRDVQRNLRVLDHDSLITNGRRIVVPGKPDDSRLIQRIADGSMPPEAEEVRLPRVSEKELQILRKWIAGGAPAFPKEDPLNPTPPVVPDSELARDVKRIFVRRCYECHKYDVAEGGIKILHHRLLLTVRKVVVPGEPDRSELYHLITAKPGDTTVMPPAPAKRLTREEVDTIRRWIAAGAPPFPKDH